MQSLLRDSKVQIRRKVRAGLHPRMLGVQREQLQRVIDNTRARGDRRIALPGIRIRDEALGFLELCAVMRRLINADLRRYDALCSAERRFAEKLAGAGTHRERQDCVLEFAADLGAGRRRLAADRRAFRRWFGVDAINDRYADEIGTLERGLVFGIERLGVFAGRVLQAAGSAEESERLWRFLDLEEIVFRLAQHPGDRRLPAQAFLSFAQAIAALPVEMQLTALSDQSLRRLYRACLDREDDTWLQIAALTLQLRAAPERFGEVANSRLGNAGRDADIFVRRSIVRLLEDAVLEHPRLARLLSLVAADASPHVRQGIALAALHAPREQALDLLRTTTLQDPEPTVRAANLLAIPQHLVYPDRIEPLRKLLQEVLVAEREEFPLRCAFRVVEHGFHWLFDQQAPQAGNWRESLRHHLELIHSDPKRTPVARRHAARALERLWCAEHPQARALLAEVRELAARTRPGSSSRVPRRWIREHPPDLLGRVLAIAAQNDFGLEIWRSWRGWRLGRGDCFRPRLWRILHEMREPASDKRQGHSHIIGRIYRGAIIAPPAGMGELSRTRVPGEPLVIGDEGGWRPYLPLPDQCLSAVDLGRCLRLYTAEGVTEILPPRGLLAQLGAHLRITTGFAELADIRNWQPESGLQPDAYAQELRKAGVEIRLRGHSGYSPRLDPGVTRFFSVSPLLFAEDLLRRLEAYAFSFYQNTLVHLLIFVLGVATVFFGRHLALAYLLRRARGRIGMVVGGWGTRGKSGTERLKAAMFNALGFGMVSKTTGCEAMFVMARPFRPLREMFLFRPYDKATIWEQHKLTQLSTRLQGEVFLWECMGLTPAYVKILQRQWMRDDISTITNTYPDHEDLQGPAGYDIPRVMVNFIPAGGHLITSEEEMRPILASAARELGTGFSSVGWLESGMLTPDVLERFPYAEHPTNIALVLALAGELGIPRDFALKEMADRVVPDLGVLKCYPVAPLRGRRIEFINGMSANERYGCLGNWKRMGFADHDAMADPGTWLMTVVNNRADREPRSKVFARILARDVTADAHLLIGSNLDGLQSFLREEWAERLASVTLWRNEAGTASDDAQDALRILRGQARPARLPASAAELEGLAAAMCRGLGLEGAADGADSAGRLAGFEGEDGQRQAIAAHMAQMRAWLDAFEAIEGALHGHVGAVPETARRQLDGQFRDYLSDAFFGRIHVVENYYASGNEVIEAVCSRIPPGLHARVMGIQNIKGTGLDFVYRFQAWERCHALCEQLFHGRATDIGEALRGLVGFAEFAPLSAAYVRDALARFRDTPGAQTETAQAQVGLIEENLRRQVEAVEQGFTATGDGSETVTAWQRFLRWAVEGLEHFLDSGDAVRRRKHADLVYRELAAQRISLDRAVQELQALNKRQKGGWLSMKLPGTG